MDSRLRFVLIAIAVVALGYFLLSKRGGEEHPTEHVLVDPRPLVVADGRAPEARVPIRAPGLDATVSTYSGTIGRLDLTEPQFRDPHTHQPMNISSTWLEWARQLRSNIRFDRGAGNVVPDYLTFDVEHAHGDDVDLVARPPGTDLEIRRTIHAHSAYAFNVVTSVTNHGAPGRLSHSQAVFHFVRRHEEESHFFRQPWERSEGICRHNGKLLREWRDDLTKHGEMGARDAEFVSLGNLYFLYALVNEGNEPADCVMRSDDTGPVDQPATGSVMRGLLVWHPTSVGTNETHEYHVIAYFGPKYAHPLDAASPTLHDAVNLGFFSIIARALLRLLQLLQSVVKNWGVAIILLTIIVRVALFPILARSIRSMAMMQKLKPEMDALNAKYKDNAEQRGLATMELYRKHKVNPLSGCLPQMAQLPVWWALYTTLQTSVELFHSPFVFWLKDLSAPDPYFVLPAILGATVFVQQKIMPASMPDPAQQKMMLYFMPGFLTVISVMLPSGLALYMLVNSVLAMIQQRLTKAQIDRLVAATPEGAIQVRPLTDAGDAKIDSGPNKNGGRRGSRR